MKSLRRIALVLVLLFLNIPILSAQTARVSGKVLDPSGAVIISADLKAFQGTVLINTAKTDERGSFALELAPGQYRFEVTATDFKRYQQNLRVTPNNPALAITMSLATVDTTVQVDTKSDEVNLDADA